jgi:hypothetical protein
VPSAAAIIDEPVEPAVPLEDGLDDSRGAVRVGQVGADRAALIAESGLDRVAVDAEDDRALRGEHACCRLSDAGRQRR